MAGASSELTAWIAAKVGDTHPPYRNRVYSRKTRAKVAPPPPVAPLPRLERGRVFQWIKANPRAWDGYPTSRGQMGDETDTADRLNRLQVHGLSAQADLQDVEDAIYHVRCDRRARYAKSVGLAAW